MGIETKKDFDLNDPVARRYAAADAELERGNDGITYLLQHLVITPKGKLWFEAGDNNPGRRMVELLWRADWKEFLIHLNRSKRSDVFLRYIHKKDLYQVQFVRLNTVAAYLEFSNEQVEERKIAMLPERQAAWNLLDSVGLKVGPLF